MAPKPARRKTRGHGLLATSLCVVMGAAGSGAEPPPAAEPEEEGAFGFDADVGWDHGITYEYRRRLSVLDSLGAPTWADEVALEGRIGGSLYLDGGWRGGTGFDDGLEGAVRRARLYTSGELRRWVGTEYKFEFAFDDGRFLLNDFYLRWRPGRFVDTLRLGYFDPPATLQNLVSSSSRALMEVAGPVAAFAPGFRLGLEASRQHRRPSLTWFFNLSTVGQRPQVGDASNEKLRVSGRLAWRPLGEPDADAALLHLGASASWSAPTGETRIRYRSRPESFLADYAVDTGDVEGSAGVLGLEAAWRQGPRRLQAEALFSRVDAEAGGTPFLYGLYLEAAWALTGERRAYDPAEALFRRLVPEQPLRLCGAGLGALELAARVSWLDLSDAGVRGGRMLAVTVGPAWTWNRWLRVLAGYVFADVRGRPDGGSQHILQSRLELAF
jgi:phosphate-selective porin OprO/OprP